MAPKSLKVVQTEIELDIYGRLCHLAARDKRSIKAVVRDAISDYVDHQEGDISQDPIFEFMGSIDQEGSDWSHRKDWRP